VISSWRIYKKKIAATAFTGEGARMFGGRWNSRGLAMIYTSASPSLAALEMLVHLDSSELMRHYLLREMRFQEALVEFVDVKSLPKNWRRNSTTDALRSIGDRWLRESRSLALAVPSAVSPLELNYLINPNHPRFRTIEYGDEVPFRFDKRLT
jgi:RES domain-containing protein